MWSIAKREFISFFSSPIGYLAIGMFHLMAFLFLWVFDTDYNILEAGFADLNLFFGLAPWLLLFLIPAVGMRSFSEEIKQGTLELLLSRPIGLGAMVMGKFWAVLLVFGIALLPNLSYVWAIDALIQENVALDWGSIIGGFIGLLLISSVFTAIALCTSILSKNAVTAYLTALLLCFFQFFGWEQAALIFTDYEWYKTVANLGMESHYTSISSGVLRLEDVVYFTAMTMLFLVVTRQFLIKLKSI